MRSRSMSAMCLCAILVLCPAVIRADAAPVSVEIPDSPPATALEWDVELLWGVVDLGGGVSQFGDLVLSGAIAAPSDEPFAVLRGFDFPGSPETGAPASPITEFALAPISPNPNHGVARVSWSLPSESSVRVSIHDIQGREVEVLADGSYPPGLHDVTWRAGERGGAGVYFVRLQVPGRVLVRRMAVIR